MGGAIGKIAEIAAPIAGAAFLGPEIGAFAPFLEGAGAAGIGAGLAETGEGLLTGKGLGKSLEGGALAGAGTFGAEELGGFLSGAGAGGGGGSTGSLLGGSGTDSLSAPGLASSVSAGGGGGIGGPGGGAFNIAAPPAAASADFGFGGDVTGGAAAGTDINAFNPGVGNLTANLGSGGAGGGQGFVNSLESNVVKGLTNPGTLLSGAGLVADAAKQGQLVKGERQLQQEAGQLTGQGQELGKYLESGTLPPGLQQGLTQQANAQKAQIRSLYASKGMSGSSAEQADLARVDQEVQTQGSQLAIQLLNSGVSESQLGAGLYKDITQNALAKDQALGQALNSFAINLGGVGGRRNDTLTGGAA